MKLNALIAAATGCLVAVVAIAQTSNAPVNPKGNAPSALPKDHPPLPAGHPTIPPAGQPALPDGHPAVPQQGQPALPDGHPALPSGHPELPAGHPPMPAATQPTAEFGSIAIQVKQGTKDGPAISGNPVIVELYHRGAVIQKLDAKLDKQGVTIFEKVSLGVPFQPLVRVNHSGVEYLAIGRPMDVARSGQQIELAVFETTDTAPAWNIQMRHLIVQPVEKGVKVTEMLTVENPGDRAWLGKPVSANVRETLAISLPRNAEQVTFEAGLRDKGIKIEPSRFVDTTPMVPGVTQLQFSYIIPQGVGETHIPVVAPAAVKQMMVFIADTGAPIKADGLQPGGSHEMGKGKSVLFNGANLPAGHQATLRITPGIRTRG